MGSFFPLKEKAYINDVSAFIQQKFMWEIIKTLRGFFSTIKLFYFCILWLLFYIHYFSVYECIMQNIHFDKIQTTNMYKMCRVNLSRTSHHLVQKSPPSTNSKPRQPMLGLPGLSEQLGWIYKSHNVHMYHKPTNTRCLMVVHPNNKTATGHQCGTIYNMTCDNESVTRTFEKLRDPEVQKNKTWANQQDHCRATGHSVSTDNTKVLTQESNWHKRKVKKDINIKQRPWTPAAHHLQPNYPAET